jgi:hypothetical protein
MRPVCIGSTRVQEQLGEDTGVRKSPGTLFFKNCRDFLSKTAWSQFFFSKFRLGASDWSSLVGWIKLEPMTFKLWKVYVDELPQKE